MTKLDYWLTTNTDADDAQAMQERIDRLWGTVLENAPPTEALAALQRAKRYTDAEMSDWIVERLVDVVSEWPQDEQLDFLEGL